MNPTPPVRISLALFFVLFAICLYFLQPDSKDVSSAESVPAPRSAVIPAASPEAASDSFLENPAPPEPGEVTKARFPAAIAATSSPVTGIHRNSPALLSVEIRNEPEQMPASAVRTSQEVRATPGAANAPLASRALAQATNLVVPIAAQEASSTPDTAAVVPQAKFPAAFVEPDPAAPLTAAQEQTVKILQKEFIDAIGGPDQAPADPEYFRRWQTARSESDQRFKTLFGVQAFLERERLANVAGIGAQK